MSDDRHRLANLRAAAFRAQQKNLCRVCKGISFEGKPYCFRHFRFLNGSPATGAPALMAAAAKGENLEQVDAFIILRERTRHNMRWIGKTLYIGTTLKLTIAGTSEPYILHRIAADGKSYDVMSRHVTIEAAIDAVMNRREIMTTHNPYARKKLIL